MSIRSRLFVVNFALTLSAGAVHHAAYAEFMAPFDEGDGLSEFESKSQMRAIVPEADDIMREELKIDALAEKEAQQIDIVDGPEIYLSDERLNDEILSVNLAERVHFNYEKAEAALAASHAPKTWWDKILNFMEKQADSAEQWGLIYLN
jgi:hypothetical protein